MSIIDNRDIPAGEVRETFDSRWCPYCNSAQMDAVETETVDIPNVNCLHATTIVWRCPKCYKKED